MSIDIMVFLEKNPQGGQFLLTGLHEYPLKVDYYCD